MTEGRPPSPLSAAYWRLWTASTTSNLGDGVFLVALPLLASRLTRDPVSISLVGVCAGIPWLLLSLPIGAIIDRSDRKRLLIRADTFRAVLVGAVAVIVGTGHARIWMLCVLALGLGVAEVFFDNATQAILPAIVAPEQLERANGRRYSAEVAANIFIGTPIGSVLFTLALWLPFAVDSASYMIAVVLVMTLHGSFRAPRAIAQRHSTLSAEVRLGVRWLWDHPLLRGLAIALGLSNFGFQMSQAVFVLFAKEELHLSDRVFGVLLSAMGIGAVCGGLLGDRIVGRLGRLRALYGAVVVWIVCLVAVGAVPVAWFVTAIAVVEALAVTVWNVCTVSLRQQLVPAHLFGRVNSVYRWFGWGSIPLGALAGGQVAAHLGLRAPYFVGAGCVAVALAVLVPTVNARTLSAASKRIEPALHPLAAEPST